MFAKINHIAMISAQNTLLQRDYQSLFGLDVQDRPHSKFPMGIAAGDAADEIKRAAISMIGSVAH